MNRLMQHMPDRPEVRTPLEPEGTFRWLHDRSSVRRPPSLREFTDAAGIDRTSIHALLPDNVRALGALGDPKLPDPHRDTLTPLQRGQAVAGFSEDGCSGRWFADHIASSRFDAVSAAQTGCNAPEAAPGRPVWWFCPTESTRPVEHSDASEADITAKALAWARLRRLGR